MNPSKWKKYDLSHDGTEELKRSGMTDDQVNSFAAFQFLRELRERKERERDKEAGEEAVEMDSRGERRVLFRKRKQGSRESGVGEEVSTPLPASHDKERLLSGGGGGGAGVVKMAEYVVGDGGRAGAQRKRKKLQTLGAEGKSTGQQKSQSSYISLSHLAEEEEEEGD